MAKKPSLEDPQELDLTDIVRTKSPPKDFQFRIGEKTYAMNYQKAFAYAHRLLKKKQYDIAAVIFSKLATDAGRGPRAHIIQAICLAGVGNYSGARGVLDKAFIGENAVLADELQDIIVMSKMGFKRDSMQDLVRLVNEHKDMPTLCL